MNAQLERLALITTPDKVYNDSNGQPWAVLVLGIRNKIVSPLFKSDHRIELPVAMASQLPSTIRQARYNKRIDCIQFVHQIGGVGFHGKPSWVNPLGAGWQLAENQPPIDSDYVEPGTVVAFQQDGAITHWAIACGEDNLLQKTGNDGKIIISSLAHTALAHAADEILGLQPRLQPSLRVITI